MTDWENMPDFREISAQGDPDCIVRFPAWFLRKNTREIDKSIYNITYRELQEILKRYGFSLVNPRGNYIDLVRIERRRPFLGLLGEKIVQTRVASIGFPRWTAQVSKSDLKRVREATGPHA